MQFVIIGLDGTDNGALERRLAVRSDHLALGEIMTKDGRMLYGAALLNDDGKMKGSMLVMNFPSEEKLNEWLKVEPYMTGDVWRDVTIHKSNTNNPAQFNRDAAWFLENL